MAATTTRIEGLDHLKAQLQALPKALRTRVLRNALAAAARPVRDRAKRLAPVLSAQGAKKAPYRKPGTVRNAIAVRTSKVARRAGNVGVFVNVRPAKGAVYKTETLRSRLLGIKVKRRGLKRASQRGAQSRNDPFYWRFLEFGTKKMPGTGFLQKAADAELPHALKIFTTQLQRWVEKVNASGKASP